MDVREQPVYDALDALNIAYRRVEHPPAHTMQDCYLVDEGLGAVHFKNLFLCNRQGTDFYLLLLVGDKPFRTKDVSKQIGVARLSFANAQQLEQYLGLTPGAVSPMGLVNDVDRRVHVLVDRDVLKQGHVIVHPNVNTASILLSSADLMRFVESRGNALTFVTIQERQGEELA